MDIVIALIETQISNLVGMTHFWNMHILKIGKPNNLKVFGCKKTEEPKQDSQNWLRSPMSEGGEPWAKVTYV